MADHLLLSAVAVVSLTLLLTPAVTAVLRLLSVLDHPNARSSHVRPTVRGGGLAPALAVVGVGAGWLHAAVGSPSFVLWTGLLVCAAGFALLGLTEDLLGVPPLPRFVAQLVIAAGAAPWLLSTMAIARDRMPFALLLAVVVLWLAGYANCFNFMDGINGISGVSALVAGLTWYAVGRSLDAAVLSTGALLVAVAALGFLPYNFPRARVFLGDTGSYFLGATLGALVLVGRVEGVPAEALLAPLALPMADAGTTLLRRVVRGEPFYLPHRDHVFQRLVALGWTHTRTTLFFGVLLTGCALLGAVSLTANLAARVAADAAILTILAGYLASPRLVLRARLAAGAAPVLPPPPATAPDEAYAVMAEQLHQELRHEVQS